jgi:hypothetical protein
MWLDKSTKISSLDRDSDNSSPIGSVGDNYAAPFRQASKLTAAKDEDQTEGGTL